MDRPELSFVLTRWTLEPATLLLAVVLGVAYARGVRRAGDWPVGRSVSFAAGLLALVWTTCGFPQVYADSLYWVWTSQTLLVWLGVPILILWGHPLQLARRFSPRVDRVLRSGPVKVLSSPLVGPALVPILSGVLFFGPLPGWSIASAPAGWLLHLVLLALGAVMVLPLVGLDEEASSLAVGLSLALGSFELVLDALPGIVLRLSTHPVTGYFDHRAAHAWSPGALRDQQVAGAILWCVAEVIDLPFLALVFRRWLRADARDAAQVDAVLEAERASRGATTRPEEPRADAGYDAPWWLSDPVMQERLRRNR